LLLLEKKGHRLKSCTGVAVDRKRKILPTTNVVDMGFASAGFKACVAHQMEEGEDR
jgi:hypothetical protein